MGLNAVLFRILGGIGSYVDADIVYGPVIGPIIINKPAQLEWVFGII